MTIRSGDYKYIAAVATLCAGCSIKPASPPVANLSAPTLAAHLDPVFSGDMLRHSFAVRNESTETVTLDLSHAGCFATWQLLSTKIGPKREILATLEVDTRNLGTGEVKYTAKLRTIAPSPAELSFTLVATVLPEFEVLPPRADFGLQRIGESALAITLTVAEGTSAKPLSIRSTDPSMSATLTRRTSREYVIIPSVRLTALPGSHFGNLVVSTSSKTTPETRIPVRGITAGS